MLDSLYQLCDNERLISDPAFEWARVAWTVEIDKGGEHCAFVSHRFLPPQEEGSKRKPKEQIKQLEVPRLFNPTTGGTRTSGDFAYFLVDKAEYALGAKLGDPAGVPQTDEKIRKRLSLFIEKIRDCAAETKVEELETLVRFLELVLEKGLPTALPESCLTNDLFAFRVAPQVELHAHEVPAVKEYWKGICSATFADDSPRNCLITGEAMAESGLFPTVKRVPGGSTSGAGLVSFNANAFESYGWKGNENAPISPLAAIKASTALARLVESNFVDAKGDKVPSRRRNIAEDTAFVFWSPNRAVSENLLATMDEAIGAGKSDPGLVSEIINAPIKGVDPPNIEAERFFALVISGAQGRIMIRAQIETSISELRDNLVANAECLRSVIQTKPPKSTGKYPPVHGISALLKACINPKQRKGVPAPMATALIRSVYQGFPYPSTMLVRALERERAEIFDDDWSARIRRDSRSAFYKAYLSRNHPERQPLLPSMNPNNREIPYLFGRLFASYGEMQRLAHYPREVNAGLVEKFFSSFMTYPNQVISNLSTRYGHNKRKALRNKSQPWVAPSANYQSLMVDRIISEIWPIESWPSLKAFGLEEQALFVLGFHHQKYWNSLKQEERKDYLLSHEIDPHSLDLVIPPIKAEKMEAPTA